RSLRRRPPAGSSSPRVRKARGAASNRLTTSSGSISMHCSDFERIWNEQLDARGAASREVQRALERHASSCPSCGQIAARYQFLEPAPRPPDAPPAAPPGFLGRFLETQGHAPAPEPRILRLRRAVVPVAAAAALFLAVLLSVRERPLPRRAPGTRPAAA